MTAFLKMHGLGNDFAVFDARATGLGVSETLARAIADRKRGIGCDQLIVIEKSDSAAAFMRIFNADGSQVEQCGNAARCVGRLLMDEARATSVTIATTGGPLTASDAGQGNVTVDMGPPRLDWREIPLAQAVDTASFALTVPGFTDKTLAEASAVSMGNPHVVLFVEDAEKAPVEALGAAIEHHPWFPARTNVEFVSRLADGRLRMRVWERGAGVTLACGTGACATAVAAHLRGLSGRAVDLVLDGGVLHIEWRESDNHVLMTGPATLSFKGDVDLQSLIAR